MWFVEVSIEILLSINTYVTGLKLHFFVAVKRAIALSSIQFKLLITRDVFIKRLTFILDALT